MVEYFTQVNPRWTDTARRLVSTDCPDCFIDINGINNGTEPGATRSWSDVRIGLLSSHVNQTDATWWGRLKLAWFILRGEYTETFSFTSREQVDAFVSHLTEISDRVFVPASTE